MTNFKQKYENFSKSRSPYKKIIGVILFVLGFLALVTPFTPGSWLIFVGLELLGLRFAVWDKIKEKILNQEAKFVNTKKVLIFLGVLGLIFLAIFLEFQKLKTSTKPVTQVIENKFIKVTSPLPNQEISSPLEITGQAKGTWFFEASFPVILTDWDGKIIARGIAQASGDWMTENFVPFTATLNFTKPTYKNNGFLILKKDNPSGLPEYDESYEIPIIFK